MAEHYKVRVTKDHLVFCSGHFISYEGDKCERLHGHNYRTAVEVEGGLDANYYLFDFIAMKRLTKVITDELDHHMLLATKNPVINVAMTFLEPLPVGLLMTLLAAGLLRKRAPAAAPA